MNVLIINPPAVDNVKIVREGRCMQRQEAWGTSWAPLTLAIVAALLRENGFQVELKDCSNDGISFEQLREMILSFQPTLIIANTSTPSIESDLTVAQMASTISPHIKVIFFGIHVTALPRETFELNPHVQFIASGEPEYTLLDFAQAVQNKTPFQAVKGLIFKNSGGEIVFNESRSVIENLDALPFPAWDLVNIPGYRLPITNRPFLLILTGRGCPYPCTFCAAKTYYGPRNRLRSPQRIAQEMKWVRDSFGVNDFLFWSENATMNHEQMTLLSEELIRNVPGVQWVCNGRVDLVDEELLALMKKSGCWMIGYGIEAGSQRVLDMMRKNITIQAMEKAVALTKKAGLEVTGHVIVGYPGETREDILATIRLVKKLDFDYIQVYCCVPFPGSDIYKAAQKNHYINTSDWAMFEQNFSVLDTPQLSAREVMALRERLVKSFYLNPTKIFKTLLKIRSWQEFKFLLSFTLEYFSAWVGKNQSKKTAGKNSK